jgi:hypothetical protein
MVPSVPSEINWARQGEGLIRVFLSTSMHLFTTPDFGLANRIRGLVGAWAHAKQTGHTLDILWTVSPACPYAIQDLFDPLPGTQYITEAHPP